LEKIRKVIVSHIATREDFRERNPTFFVAADSGTVRAKYNDALGRYSKLNLPIWFNKLSGAVIPQGTLPQQPKGKKDK